MGQDKSVAVGASFANGNGAPQASARDWQTDLVREAQTTFWRLV
jgi:hypothetical protein